MKNIKIYWKSILNYGLLLGILFSLVVLLSYKAGPLIWAKDFPMEVQAQIGEIPKDAAVKGIVVFVIILVLMLVFPVFLNKKIIQTDISHASFPNLWINGFLLLNFMNLFDALVVDILIFNTIKPDFMIIQGTEDYIDQYVTPAFHFIAFLKGQPYMLVIALLSTGIGMLLKARYSKKKTYSKNRKQRF